MRKLKTSVEDHLTNKCPEIISLFSELQAKISMLSNVDPKATDPYIGYRFKVGNKRPKLFVEVHVQIKKIELHLRRIDYKETPGIKVAAKPDTHRWILSKVCDVYPCSNLDLVMQIIEQSYRDIAH